MKPSRLHLTCLLAVTFFIFQTANAAPNNWTNNSGGFWRYATNWSLASPPNSTSGLSPTQITNANTKTVVIDASTATSNLSIRVMTLSAPTGSTNTLLLSNLVAAFAASGNITLSNRSVLLATNCSINANSGFDIGGGSLNLNSANLTCATTCDLSSGNLTINGGTLTATAGTTGIRCGRYSGANSTLTINNGNINTIRLTLGSVANTTANLILNGGTLWLNSTLDPLSVGQIQNTTCNVTVSGGTLIATNGFTSIGTRSTAAFTQTGGDVRFGDLTVGDTGLGTYSLSGGTLSITPFQATNLFIIGNLENGIYNQSGGLAIIRTETHIADFAPYTGEMNITGGTLIATNDLFAIGRESIGAMTISNASVVLTNASVGRHINSFGTLNIQSGANVSLIADLSIGRLDGAQGIVNMTGGSLTLTNDDIWVGRGGTGEMNISGGTVTAKRIHVGSSDDGTNAPVGTLNINGGNTFASTGFYVGTLGLSTGNVAVASGYLCVTNTGTNQIEFLVSAGNFTLSGGTMDVESISLTNLAGTFTFNSGIIRAKSMTVNNSHPFTVGNGSDPATLQLQGGIYNFANGLVISPNATVTGCGTIVGSIVNNGTLSTNCGPVTPLAPIVLKTVNYGTGGVTVNFSTTNGQSYTLQYTTNLQSPVWTSITPAVAGSGNLMSLIDSNTTDARRYYRIHSP